MPWYSHFVRFRGTIFWSFEWNYRIPLWIEHGNPCIDNILVLPNLLKHELKRNIWEHILLTQCLYQRSFFFTGGDLFKLSAVAVDNNWMLFHFWCANNFVHLLIQFNFKENNCPEVVGFPFIYPPEFHCKPVDFLPVTWDSITNARVGINHIKGTN